jgi:hypothetical protein
MLRKKTVIGDKLLDFLPNITAIELDLINLEINMWTLKNKLTKLEHKFNSTALELTGFEVNLITLELEMAY